MEVKYFIGKVVISPKTNIRYILYNITASYIEARAEKPDVNGYHTCYRWETINGDPISNGYLTFEDTSLTEPFRTAYNTYCQTKNAYWEMYGYWMRKD